MSFGRRDRPSNALSHPDANEASALLSFLAALLHHHIPHGNSDRLFQSSCLRIGYLGSHRTFGSIPRWQPRPRDALRSRNDRFVFRLRPVDSQPFCQLVRIVLWLYGILQPQTIELILLQ